FLRAAIWPDWVRDPYAKGLSQKEHDQIRDDHHKGPWHFVNLPFVHPDEVKQFNAVAIRKKVLEPELDDNREPRHALAALKNLNQLPVVADNEAAKKAIRLCWLLHLVGDIHQPLHATALFASEKKFQPPFTDKHGDEGGNKLAVRIDTNDPEPMIL